MVVRDGVIADLRVFGAHEAETPFPIGQRLILPGVIDSHCHFREPGLTAKADWQSESRAARLGGVTTIFEMPNTVPNTVDAASLAQKRALARARCEVNYALFPGATNDNAPFLRALDAHSVPGIKLFMGSSTGNMLVDQRAALDEIFALAAEKGLVLMAHCEDTKIINDNLTRIREELGVDDPPVSYHPLIRSAEACYASTALGVELARAHDTRFHIAHITTARELELLGGTVTGEVCVAHLLFTDADYATLGTMIKCNPAVKSADDRQALRDAVRTGRLTTISTDHAPHLLSDKEGGAVRAASGMPMLQFSLPAMLTLAEQEHIPFTRIVEMMCHNPAQLFGVQRRGFIRKGYHADLTIVERQPWTVTRSCVASKCGWSPLEGRQLTWRVLQTICSNNEVEF